MMGEEVVVELPPDDLPEEEIEALDTFEASEQVLESFVRDSLILIRPCRQRQNILWLKTIQIHDSKICS